MNSFSVDKNDYHLHRTDNLSTFKNMAGLDRFVDVSQESGKLLEPIEGYQSLPLVTLEIAVESIVDTCPDVRRRAWIAKTNCDLLKDGLAQDESAAIYLYTAEWQPQHKCVYAVLNSTLRSKNRDKLIQPWFPYMKLLLMALFKLPSHTTTVWRGVRLDLRTVYEVGKTYTWWGFSSCTRTISVLQSKLFLGQEGKRTIFSIECFDGKTIRGHSSFEGEDEILLLPGTQFIVKGHLQPSEKDPDLIIIQLEQIQPPFVLLEPPDKDITLSAHMPNSQISRSISARGKSSIFFFGVYKYSIDLNFCN